MMLARAGGPTRAVLRDVHLVDRVEGRRAVAREQARQAGRESGAHDETHTAPTRLSVEREQRGDVLDAVAHGHHVRAALEVRAHEIELLARGGRQHDDRNAVPVDLGTSEGHRALTERGADLREAHRVGVVDEDLVDVRRRDQLPGSPGAHSAEPDDGGAHVSEGLARTAHAIRRPAAGCRLSREPGARPRTAGQQTGPRWHASTPSWWG